MQLLSLFSLILLAITVADLAGAVGMRCANSHTPACRNDGYKETLWCDDAAQYSGTRRREKRTDEMRCGQMGGVCDGVRLGQSGRKKRSSNGHANSSGSTKNSANGNAGGSTSHFRGCCVPNGNENACDSANPNEFYE